MGDYNRVSSGYEVDLLSQKGLQVSHKPRTTLNPKPKKPKVPKPKLRRFNRSASTPPQA